MKPKLCINNSCKNIMYVPASMLHMCLQCKTCVEKADLIEKEWDTGK